MTKSHNKDGDGQADTNVTLLSPEVSKLFRMTISPDVSMLKPHMATWEELGGVVMQCHCAKDWVHIKPGMWLFSGLCPERGTYTFKIQKWFGQKVKKKN